MAKQTATQRAKSDKKAGKAATTQAGEFVKDEIDAVRSGEHGVRNTKQAIAIGLSKARRAGVDLPPPKNASAAVKKKAAQDKAKVGKKVSPTRSAATTKALQREGQSAVSKKALSKHAKSVANRKPST